MRPVTSRRQVRLTLRRWAIASAQLLVWGLYLILVALAMPLMLAMDYLEDK